MCIIGNNFRLDQYISLASITGTFHPDMLSLFSLAPKLAYVSTKEMSWRVSEIQVSLICIIDKHVMGWNNTMGITFRTHHEQHVIGSD